EPVAFQAPRTSSYSKKKDSQGKQPGAKTGRRKKSTYLTTKHNPLSKIEATKGGPSSKEEIKSPLAIPRKGNNPVLIHKMFIVDINQSAGDGLETIHTRKRGTVKEA
ncbi:hypothetical protein Tco_1149254, partial [Tanacetum coccineum]